MRSTTGQETGQEAARGAARVRRPRPAGADSGERAGRAARPVTVRGGAAPLGAALVGAALALGGCSTGTAATTAGPTPSATATGPSITAPTGAPTTSPATSADPSTTSDGPSATSASTPDPSSPSDGGSEPGTPATAAPPPSAPGPTTPGPTASPSQTPAEPALLRRGDSGQQVRQVQERLSSLGYWLGEPDGTYGTLTRQAVLALQGAAGLGRDGVLGPDTRRALDAGTLPRVATGQGRAVEVDRDAGLVVVADDGRPTTVLHTSTGTFERYTSEGEQHLADTPAGTFDVYRAVDGWDGGPLGDLYRPRYFQRDGIAVHGFPSVPAHPASHGCARVSLAAMDMIWAEDLMPIGTTVVVR